MGTEGMLTRSPVGGKGRLFHGRRIDPDLDVLAQQIADQPVERLVRPVADVVVIAREQGDAKIARFHERAVGISA